MKFEKSISVFIPAYNEEENLEETTKEIINFLRKNFKKFEFIIVVNVSTDRTLEIAKKLEKKYREVRVIEQKKFVGYGTQLKTGWENAKNELVFYTDADRQFDIHELKNFMNFIDKYDLVIGYRKKRKDPKLRILYSKLFNLTLRFLVGLKFRDVDCAFKLCKKEVIDKISPLKEGLGKKEEGIMDALFLLKAQSKKFKIKELPVTHKPRMAGTSKAELPNFVGKVKPELIISLIKDTLNLRRLKNKLNSRNGKTEK